MSAAAADALPDDAFAAIRGVEGWLTDAQATRLWRAARAVPVTGQIVEIGSFRGRSAIVLARAAAPGVAITAIDPHLGSDRGPREYAPDRHLGEADRRAFLANLEAAGVLDRVRHVRRLSADALGDVEGPVTLLFVDGAHRYAPALDDLRGWGARVPVGGRMLVHDAYSSVGVTLALLRAVVGRRAWRYVGRSGSLAEYARVADQPRAARAREAVRAAAQLPWFARNLVVKALILARLRPLARALGHRHGPWPY